ncbi:non-ribosomal peptide synthetase [Mucilaginibacter sp. KACC 22063]|uniref:non-ribosomal peptide synthetase n=1 Tax=Mucilaginibacter sp. KACC 22063 TaxID=3025666 RepID=UPI0023667610|nr:non-ribosomal peptide synthetase [Mucilaginibacter sp. KACC 22063]WDF57315.1 amino acid adenylation domain-containing protein [Mucilaginibacter sp. KACC 22063]
MSNEIKYIYPATSLQQGFIYHALSQPDDDAYRMQILYDYYQALDVEKYIRAWEYCIARYPILRTAFNWEEDVIQVIYSNGKLNYRLHDLSQLATQEEKDQAIDFIQTEDRKVGFDLTNPTLLRIHIIKQAENYYTVLKSEHHAITDGWSEPVLLASLHRYYQAVIENREVCIDEDVAYILAQEYIAENKQATQEYWSNHFIAEETANDINSLLSKLFDANSYRRMENPEEQQYEINGDFYDRLKSFCRQEGITVNAVLQFAWHKLLQVYSSKRTTIVGTTVSGRDLPIEGIEDSVGLYVNTLPLAIDWDNELSIKQQLQQVQQNIMELSTHSFADLAKIQKNGERLFHSLFVFENYPEPADEPVGLKTTIRNDIDKVDYPLGILAFEDKKRVVFKLQYDANYLDSDKAIGHTETLAYLLKQVITNPEKKHNRLHLITPKAYRQIVYEWNMTDRPYPKEKTLHELFEVQAMITPENTALVYKGTTLSYRELNNRSNQLALEIRKRFNQKEGKPLSPDTLVALFTNKSLETVIGMLAILKAGAAYVPVDPDYPAERVAWLLNDTQAALILSQRYLEEQGKLIFPEGRIIFIDPDEPFYKKNNINNLIQNCTSADLAYVIYTSGTTGKPKGVMVEHRSVTNEILSQLRAIPLTPSDQSLLTAGIIFDAAAECIYMSLLSGGTLHIVDPSSLLDNDFIRNYLKKELITVVNTTPSYLKAISLSQSAHLKYIILGGEPYQQITSSAKIYNTYGPTEATIVSTLTEINSQDPVHIGKPIDNTRAYVLDTHQNVVPVGVTGELYLGGIGVARGYLNQPGLTAERFILNPFATDADKESGYNRLYKTGDMVRWLPDGNLQYIGRNDDQVKINGYRIEPAEITRAVLAIEGIEQACVLAREKITDAVTAKYLVCYYVVNSGKADINSSALQNKLSKVLPSYMVPATYVAMESFPLTVNGKLDKRALPDPDFNLAETERVAPVTETEKEICKIWELLFGMDNISITDNFFRLGGDSILSIQVAGRIRQAGYPCKVKDIFEHKTIAELAAHLQINSSETIIDAEQGILTGELDFLPIQQWFLSHVGESITKPGHWNQSFLIKVPELHTYRLQSIIHELIDRHDVFRIAYSRLSNQLQWRQRYQQRIDVPVLKTLNVSTLTAAGIQQTLTDWQSNFDLEHGPLFQFGYLHGYSDGSARIFMAAHHMVIDSVSWRIVADDLKALYQGVPLPPKSSSYRQWVTCVKKYALQHPDEPAFWQNQLKGMPAYQQEPLFKPTVSRFELSEALTSSLLQNAPAAYHTEINDLLLTALAYALKDINHSDTQIITLEGHGREEIDPSIDLSRTVGWFTTMFPVKIELKGSLKESIQLIKESLRKVPNKGIGFGALATCEQTSFTQSHLPRTSFNYLGQFDGPASDWKIIDDNSGDNVHPENNENNLISVDGMVNAGRLKFIIETRLGAAVTKLLTDSFEYHLKLIISHCTNALQNNFTPSDFRAVKISQSLLDRLADDARHDQNQIAFIYPASSLQQGFIYHALNQPGDDTYRMQAIFDYHQPIDIEKYLQAWAYCIAQYPILRTAFNWEEEVVQVIYSNGKLNYRLHDLSQLTTQEGKHQAIAVFQSEDLKTGFDLTVPGLLRLTIIKQAEDHFTIIKTEHHAITDGWSESILLASLHRYYQALTGNKIIEVKEDTAYIAAREYIAVHKNTVQKYWDDAFAAPKPANNINSLLSKPLHTENYRRVESQAVQNHIINSEKHADLKSFSQQEGITINVLLQFAWHKLLQVYSSAQVSIAGTTVSGRDLPIEGIEDSVGLYINTLPLVIDWENDLNIREQLQHVQQKIMELNTHSFADLAKIQKNGERLFQTLFVYENYLEPVENSSSITATAWDMADKLDYPLGLIVFEQQGALVIRLVYDAAYLTESRAKYLLNTINRIIRQIMDNPGKAHKKISLPDTDEYDKIINGWNVTDRQYPLKTVVQLFEDQAYKTPDSIALIYTGQQLTYEELNNKSNQLALYIRAQYLQDVGRELTRDILVALYLDRGPEMVIAILAVLKAGGAYVPIEINYPRERVEYILNDGNIKLVISNRLLAGQMDFSARSFIFADLAESLYLTGLKTNLPAFNGPQDLACVIYTSGTTGKPKGVMLTHASLTNRILYMIERSGIDAEDHYLFKTNYVFDVSITDIFTHLCAGAKLQVTKEVFDLAELNNLLEISGVTSLHLVPSQYELLADAINASNIIKVYFSGEAITPKIITRVNKNIRILNYYGPTETGEITVYEPKNENDFATIGKLFPNSRHYVLGQGDIPVPIGVIGELFIGGISLALGYLNRHALTDERFIDNPFATKRDRELGYNKLYKTGDLVRWLSDGNLEYVGRNDDQVKIRGHRVELGEIEQVLAQADGLKQSCVLAKERKTGNSITKYLVAYYVPHSDNHSLNENVLGKYLRQLLPAYMVPDMFVEMTHMPLTPNGKLDKQSLPEPDFNTLNSQFILPTTELEAGICRIWQEVLGAERVGIQDDFFRIGGNSILAIQAAHRMSKLLGYELKVGDIFRYKTPEQILSSPVNEIIHDEITGKEFEI